MNPQGPTEVIQNSHKMTATCWPSDYWRNLVQFVNDERGEPALGEFSKLQVLNITHLLNQIVRIKADVQHNQSTSPEQMDLLQQTLHQYGKDLIATGSIS
jgi:hypothetical protein